MVYGKIAVMHLRGNLLYEKNIITGLPDWYCFGIAGAK